MTGELVWKCRDRTLNLSERPLIMGILNVTPDSFSDGGKYFDTKGAVERGLELISQGADIVDIGGESTRPGASQVTVNEELCRVIPVVSQLCRETEVLISVDTMKAEVAREALEAGAHIINDVSAFTHDPCMADAAIEHGAGVVLMHMLRSPETMQKNPTYDNVVNEVKIYLKSRTDELVERGLRRSAIALDPGIGFGKTVEHNVQLLAGIGSLKDLGLPVAVGVSRKSFLGKLTGRETGDRVAASLAALTFSIMKGANIVRVHDVRESCDAGRIAAVLNRGTTDNVG